ncbi:MJ1255/VC2487 family glycosyltransferase [Vibrio metschnikovii]|uniref:Glycosyltransferase n=1 Tax=Vibrio metschnikovii TaxID=28172 RepID=A0A9X0UHS7_VIBME|nr:MJ1255/VC2487 family glycosyltransferase [Vibrio metschnikovii]MBC3621474.1 glycosyltransferase [Vibrio metschnikovii]MBC5851522.1 glycosyltransferase [Vibrio metschnikovii]
MKILYGVQGTGNGHIARARAMSNAFKQRHIEVDFLFSGRDAQHYFSMECFGHYQTRHGLTFISQRGKVSYLKTLCANRLGRYYQEVTNLDLSGYDLVINDFEPVTAWAAKQQGITSISLSHQNAFRYSVPIKGASWLDKSIMQHFSPANYYLALHWYHFNQPILPPIIHSSNQSITNQGFILVYLPFEDLEQVCELLTRFTHQSFICYHPAIEQSLQVDNLHLKPLSHQSFQIDLHRCSGVIANGGFELPSEALSLGKKLLLKPLIGQFEQQSNVATLELLGLAASMNSLDAFVISGWLNEQDIERVHYPDVAGAIVDWLLNGNWACHSELSQQLWKQVDFPNYAALN